MNNNQEIKFRLGIDLDGVIYNFVDEFFNYYAELKGMNAEEFKTPSCWEFYKDLDLTEEEYYTISGKAAIQGKVFKDGLPCPGAIDGMRNLYETGLEIVIITARELSTNPDHLALIRKNTEDWLIKYEIPYHELIISNDKSKHGLDVLIDDNLLNIENVVLGGGLGYIFDQPWNRGHNFYSRIYNWEDLVLQMENLQARVKDVLENQGQNKISGTH